MASSTHLVDVKGNSFRQNIYPSKFYFDSFIVLKVLKAKGRETKLRLNRVKTKYTNTTSSLIMRVLLLSVVNINRFRARVTRLDVYHWVEQRPVKITWDPVQLGLESQTVDILLSRFAIRDDGHVYFHSMYTLKTGQLNTGEAIIIVPRGKGTG